MVGFPADTLPSLALDQQVSFNQTNQQKTNAIMKAPFRTVGKPPKSNIVQLSGPPPETPMIHPAFAGPLLKASCSGSADHVFGLSVVVYNATGSHRC